MLLRVRGLPTWVALLGLYALSRAISTGLLAGAYLLFHGWSLANVDGSPGFLGFLLSWDGKYYEQIAAAGYPTHLPANGDGSVAKSPWAFLPLFPAMVRGAAGLGLDPRLAGVLVAVAFGFAATVALHRLLLPKFGPKTALWGALFFCFGPMSFVLQVAYAEGVFLFFMFCALGAMTARRYLLMIPFAVGAAFAHPGAIALAAALGIHSLLRLREPFPLRERLTAGVALVVITAAGFAWPVVAAAITGNPSAYFDTELAWWRDYISVAHFLPFTPWFTFAGHYWGVFGVTLVVLVLAAFAWWLTRPSARALGPDLIGYAASYAAYLVAVFLPQQSLFRMLLPLSPLLGEPVLSRTTRSRRITLSVSVLLQPVAILLLWVIWPP
ncbi:MAG: hypothetical protein JWM49_442 [Microbacteriaceae bacterium]|nr:hypothetical protein [Microbacteriaceae bacterium]